MRPTCLDCAAAVRSRKIATIPETASADWSALSNDPFIILKLSPLLGIMSASEMIKPESPFLASRTTALYQSMAELLICPQVRMFLSFLLRCGNARFADPFRPFHHPLARLASPGAAPSVIAESILAKQSTADPQSFAGARSQPRPWDRIVAGWCALFIRPVPADSLSHRSKNRQPCCTFTRY